MLVEPDGVLFDLRAPRARAVRGGLAAEGVDAAAAGPAALAAAAALPVAAAVRAAAASAAAAGDPAARALDPVGLDLAAHRAERLFGAELAGGALTLHEGAREAIAALGARLCLGIVTTLARADAARLLDAAGLALAFAVVVAADDRLPAAAPAAVAARYAAALTRLGRRLPALAPAHAVALVALPAAAADARAAGVRAVLVDHPDAAAGAATGVCADVWDAPHRPADAAGSAGARRGADVRLNTLRGITSERLACALDLAPGSCSAPSPP